MSEDLKNYTDDDAALNAQILGGLAVLGAMFVGFCGVLAVGFILHLLGVA